MLAYCTVTLSENFVIKDDIALADGCFTDIMTSGVNTRVLSKHEDSLNAQVEAAEKPDSVQPTAGLRNFEKLGLVWAQSPSCKLLLIRL